MTDHYLLSDVARILDLKPHKIVYSLTTRQIPEPALRVANKRVFSAEDVLRLASHFHVTPNWSVMDTPTDDQEPLPQPDGLVIKTPFQVFQSTESGHVVQDGDGAVFCWAVGQGQSTGDRGTSGICDWQVSDRQVKRKEEQTQRRDHP